MKIDHLDHIKKHFDDIQTAHSYVLRIGEKFDGDHDFDFDSHAVSLSFVGSHSHGTYVPPSDPDAIDDIDFMTIIMPPKEYVLGLSTFDHWTYQGHDELDVVAYSFQKFMGLLLKGNPNVMGMLWIEESDFLIETPLWRTLRDHRDLFAATSITSSFTGYAQGQLSRMVAYTPEIDAEIQALTVYLTNAGWNVDDVMSKNFDQLPNLPFGYNRDYHIEKAKRLRELRARYHAAYMGEKRRSLVLKHGYDTKNAAHLVRLLRMCVEFLQTGTMQVRRTWDVEQLRSIKRGEWAVEDVRVMAEGLFNDVTYWKEHSALPPVMDFKRISSFVADLTYDFYASKA